MDASVTDGSSLPVGSECEFAANCLSGICTSRRCAAAPDFVPVADVAAEAIHDLAAADFNADGFGDVAVLVKSPTSIRVDTYLSKGSNAKLERVGMFSFLHGSILHAHDLDGDSRTDLILVDRDIGVLKGDGQGSFAGPIESGPLQPEANQVIYFGAGAVAGDASSSDLIISRARINNDAPIDGFQTLWLGTKEATFSLGRELASGIVVDADLGDINKDGRNDIAWIRLDQGHYFSVQLLLGNGDGSFMESPAPVYDLVPLLWGASYHIRLVDMDLDGMLDIVLVIASRLEVWSGGLEKFVRTASVALQAPATLEVVDVNGDSYPDVVVPTRLGPAAILTNNGQRGFAAVKKWDWSLRGCDLFVISDVDGDSRPDLVGAELGGNHLAILRNITEK